MNTIRHDIETLLKKYDGLTSAQIMNALRADRPQLSRNTVHPVLSRMSAEKLVYRHLSVWYIWPETAR